MARIVFVSSDSIARGLFSAAAHDWGHDPIEATPKELRRICAEWNTDELAAFVVDIRQNARETLVETARLRSQRSLMAPIILVCLAAKSVDRGRAKAFGVHEIVEATGEARTDLRGAIERVLAARANAPSGMQMHGNQATGGPGSMPATNGAAMHEAQLGGPAAAAVERQAVAVVAAGDAGPDQSHAVGGVSDSAVATESQSAGRSGGGPVKWLGLYNDRGLLMSETAPRDAASESGSTPMSEIACRRKRRELEEMLAGYAEARPMKASVQLAMRTVRDPNASVDDLAEVIRCDQALAAKVLRVANSAAYRRGRPVRSIEQAAVRIGLESMRQAISVAGAMEQVGSDANELVNPAMLWEHSFVVATIAAELAKVTKACDPNDAFMAGLLHDIGRVMLFDLLGDEYAEALQFSRQYAIAPHRVEKQMFEIDHADAAGIVLRSWDFDESIAGPVGCHHLSEANLHHLEPSAVDATLLLQTANRIARAGMFGDSGNDWIDSDGFKPGRVAPTLLRTMIQRAEQCAGDMRALLANASPDSADMQDYVLVLKDRLSVRFSPIVVADAEQYDEMNLLVDRIASPGEANTIVAIVRTPADLRSLGAKIKAVEEERGGKASLPIVVMGDFAAGAAEKAIGKSCVELVRPFRVVALVQGVNRSLAASGADAEPALVHAAA